MITKHDSSHHTKERDKRGNLCKEVRPWPYSQQDHYSIPSNTGSHLGHILALAWNINAESKKKLVTCPIGQLKLPK